jgi:endonuclease G
VWGTQEETNDAVKDTYHYTNAAPQEHSFNDGLWGDLEDYILQLAQLKNQKITVFTGPVFAARVGPAVRGRSPRASGRSSRM